MSLTKRHIDSLTEEERNEILGSYNEWDAGYEAPPVKSYIVTPPALDEGDSLWRCGGCERRWPLSELSERGCPDCRDDEPDCDHPFRVTGDVCLNCGERDVSADDWRRAIDGED